MARGTGVPEAVEGATQIAPSTSSSGSSRCRRSGQAEAELVAAPPAAMVAQVAWPAGVDFKRPEC